MNRYLSPTNVRSLYWRGMTLLLLFLTACAAPATPVIQATPVPPQVDLVIQTDQQQITVGHPVAIVMTLNPPVAITEATWTVLSGQGDLQEKTNDVVVFTPSTESELMIIQVKGKTEAGTPFQQTINFRVVAPTEAPATQPVVEKPTVNVTVETQIPSLVTQDTLQDSQTVPCQNFIEGTYDKTVTEQIWPVIYVGGMFHPQDDNGKAPRMEDGKWFDTVRFGDCSKPAAFNRGTRFQLLIITSGPVCQKQIEDYLATARARGFPGMPGLADDCHKVTQAITVTRE